MKDGDGQVRNSMIQKQWSSSLFGNICGVCLIKWKVSLVTQFMTVPKLNRLTRNY